MRSTKPDTRLRAERGVLVGGLEYAPSPRRAADRPDSMRLSIRSITFRSCGLRRCCFVHRNLGDQHVGCSGRRSRRSRYRGDEWCNSFVSRGTKSPVSFLATVPLAGAPFPPRGPSAWFPRLQRYYGALRLLVVLLASLRFLRSAIPVLRPETTRPGSQQSLTRVPRSMTPARSRRRALGRRRPSSASVLPSG
jgi:hypothetical protein